MTILIPYRPSHGGMDGVADNLRRTDDGDWEFKNQSTNKFETCQNIRKESEDVLRCVISINKNSYFKHNILILIDHDVEPKENWMKEFDNVKIFKSNNSHCKIPQERQQFAFKESIMSLGSDLLVCYALNSDTVVAKNWDLEITNAFNQFGTEYVYAPMFVEPRTKKGRSNLNMTCLDPTHGENIKRETIESGPPTADNIWNNWRREICCHSLTMLLPLDRDYMTESDMDNYIKIANEAKLGCIQEDRGVRGYGYWAPLIAKCDKFKQVLSRLEMPLTFGGDFFVDNNIPVKKKIVVTTSFVFHFHIACRLDNIEVSHEQTTN